MVKSLRRPDSGRTGGRGGAGSLSSWFVKASFTSRSRTATASRSGAVEDGARRPAAAAHGRGRPMLECCPAAPMEAPLPLSRVGLGGASITAQLTQLDVPLGAVSIIGGLASSRPAGPSMPGMMSAIIGQQRLERDLRRVFAVPSTGGGPGPLPELQRWRRPGTRSDPQSVVP